MKKVFSVMTVVFLTADVIAQVPEKMSYQAVIYNSSNQLVTNQTVGIRISILQGAAYGMKIYTENQTPMTNDYGLVSIKIGGREGFDTIDWANGPYFIKTETDPTGGTNYTITGTSQLLSVPFALHAKTADNIRNMANMGNNKAFDGWDKDVSDDFDGDYNSLTNAPDLSDTALYLKYETDPVFIRSIASGITETDTVNWNNKLSSFTESQNLSDVLAQNNSANNRNITNLADPVNDQDAVTKAYVDILKEQIEELQALMGPKLKPKDADGNVYDTVTIGTQVWMAENLKTTKYNDGTSIPLVTSNSAWSNSETPGYCWYNNNASYKNVYGAIYNWYTVNTGKLCPSGWHVPTDEEWKVLENHLITSGYNYDGTTSGNKIAKALSDTLNWISSGNTGAVGNTDYPEYRNKTGFSALPGGFRTNSGPFIDIGYIGTWWSTTDFGYIWYRFIYNNHDKLFSDYQKKNSGFSVRCLKN